jgi:hypothetical protein
MATQFSSIDRLNVPSEWIAMEHYRLHTVEAWPESPRKNASLEAIHSALGALMADPAGHRQPDCDICRSRNKGRAVAQFPSRLRLPLKTGKAA